MKIGIYDTEHFETCFTIVKLFDITSNTITLFATQEVAIPLRCLLGDSASRYTWIILNKKSLRNGYDIYLHCKKNKIDVLLLNTVSRHHLAFGILCLFLKNVKSIVVVHDAN